MNTFRERLASWSFIALLWIHQKAFRLLGVDFGKALSAGEMMPNTLVVVWHAFPCGDMRISVRGSCDPHLMPSAFWALREQIDQSARKQGVLLPPAQTIGYLVARSVSPN